MAEDLPADGPNYPIGSVDNALRMLLLFRTNKSLRLSEAAATIGVARSTAHRLLAMLAHYGLVRQEEGGKAYLPGPSLIDVGLSVVRDLDLRTQARGALDDLCKRVGETVGLAILEGRDVRFLDTVETTKSVRVGSRTGLTMPAHTTSVGKVLLSSLSRKQLLELYPNTKLSGGTTAAITSRAKLFRELEIIAENGYATNFGESEADVAGVSMAVLDRLGRARAAVSVVAPSSRFRDDTVTQVLPALKETVDELGTGLV
jgi:IclR family acetate operon transcriptional repressor